ncbi:MAG: c-type cytochrome [Bacteroidia bacterium]|nr:c-type cytochrome [Bacteroidia bacterium]
MVGITGWPKMKEHKTPDIKPNEKTKEATIENNFWKAPDTSEINSENNAEQITYGRALVRNTSYYFGPKGKIAALGNGMNCQNCHLDAGTRLFGNNFAAVASTYPKFRDRSGTKETILKRVSDCFERSLNGKAPDTSCKEMQAILAYIKWLGRDVRKDEKPEGSGIKQLAYLDRAADPEKGKITYQEKCQRCHGADGQGQMADESSFKYPPLWGKNSYNIGAGLYRLSRFAGYVKYNMPQGATFEEPQLTDEQAWDLAAFVNSQDRPYMDLSKDWPKIAGKPVDHPFGPYADKFSERQHKYGPYSEMVKK